MYKHKRLDRTFLFGATMCILIMGVVPAAVAGEEEAEILNITVGQPTQLSHNVMQNQASVMASRTGVVAAFYPTMLDNGPKFYRVSTDRGYTWSGEMKGPPQLGGGQDSGTLRDGGVIMPTNDPRPSAKGKKGWYDVQFVRFTDDMLSWESETVEIYMPTAGPPSLDVKHPGLSKGKMVQLPNGDMLAPMYGGFEGDLEYIHRSIIVRSTDQGRTWRFYASIAYEPVDPRPDLPGQYLCAAEPSITLLPNGKMVAMLRSQYSHMVGEYKPMSICWSDDLGKTWTKPEYTTPHLMNISPTLAALDNGVVACQYGRPGFHVAFSLDDGHTWQDRVTFSDLPTGVITGQFDMIKTGPNNLVAIGSDKDGTKVWPISVERTTTPVTHVTLSGRVVSDFDGFTGPVVDAIVELSPNRYAANDWLEHPTLRDLWYQRDPVTVGSPQLSYRSIRKENGYPTATADSEGDFRFESVKIGEYVLTVEADGYAPQHRHIKVEPTHKGHYFRLKPGRKICNQVVDSVGQPIAGACVVLNRWHIHTDPHGYYHWSVKTPQPQQVTMRVYKKYEGQFDSLGYPPEILKTTVNLSQLESQPITLKNH